MPDSIKDNATDKSPLFEAAFRIPGCTHLQLNAQDRDDLAVEYLDHVVARTHGDLRSHVQRVHVYIDKQDAEAVYGALLDLFIALTDRGRPLRERMLTLSRTLIGEENYNILLQRLDSGITATDALPPSRKSLLSRCLRGTNQLVTRINEKEGQQQDPLDEAHDCLEYGQVDEAREVLEAAILKYPARPELHHELLAIYKSTDARETFSLMRQRLTMKTNPAADAWREMALFFGEDS